MSFFWNQPQVANAEFGPFFRFLEEVAEQSAQPQAKSAGCHSAPRAHFRPKFDVAETEAAYELFGDLPGVSQQDLDVEFPDAQTLTVRGKVVRRQPESTTTAEAAEPTTVASDDDAASTKGKQASVEDDDEYMQVEKQGEQEAAPAEPAAAPKPEAPKFKFHSLERKLGNFSRTFTFPAAVDTDAVRANLKDGVLSITVPKSTKPSAKKVFIQ